MQNPLTLPEQQGEAEDDCAEPFSIYSSGRHTTSGFRLGSRTLYATNWGRLLRFSKSRQAIQTLHGCAAIQTRHTTA